MFGFVCIMMLEKCNHDEKSGEREGKTYFLALEHLV